MSTNTKKIELGLAYPNAIIVGSALIFFGGYGLYNTYWGQEHVTSFILITKTVFLILPILLGLIPFTSTKHLEFDDENMYSFNRLFSFIKIGSTFKIDDYNAISLRKGNELFDFESLADNNSQPEYSLKFYDILLRDKEGNYTIFIKNIGTQNKAKLVFDEIRNRTDFEY